MTMLLMRWSSLVPSCAAASLVLTGCGASGTSGTSDAAGAGSGAGDRPVSVVAAFYPLQFVAERVAGDRAAVTGLTAPGAEPHDLELSPEDLAGLVEADLVLYQEGFQPAVDDAVASEGGENALDVAPVAGLDLAAEEHEGEGEEHAEDEHAEEEHAEEATDPHSWLDPTRLAGVVEAVGARLTEVDPDGEQVYAENARALTDDLAALDQEFSAGLAGCTNRTLVTSHEAFAYLAQRYDFEQVGISGLSPEDEPDAGRTAEVADLVRERGVSTVYFETLVDPAVAEVVAAETGARTAVLDPVEGLSEASAGEDYLAVQRANLAALRAGQSCP